MKDCSVLEINYVKILSCLPVSKNLIVENINRLVITGSVLKIQVPHLKSVILTRNRVNDNPFINFKTIISFTTKSTMNKNGETWTFSQPPLFRKGTQAGDTRLPIRNKAELETGSHLQQKSRQDNDALCFHSVYRLYLRPNTVSSRWDTVGAPRDFIPGGLLQPRGQAGPPAHNSKTDRQEGSAGTSEGNVL